MDFLQATNIFMKDTSSGFPKQMVEEEIIGKGHHFIPMGRLIRGGGCNILNRNTQGCFGFHMGCFLLPS